MSKTLCYLALLVCAACPAHAQDARQIMTEVQNRTQSKSEHYEGSLEVINTSQKTSKKHDSVRKGKLIPIACEQPPRMNISTGSALTKASAVDALG